mmetsp:Transcript_8423/g.20931  ORF Transcript_8423/g.20931 Transcript_8423/m.20931 type:complete len:324 (-) Transcript_8423:45-1016(-)
MQQCMEGPCQPAHTRAVAAHRHRTLIPPLRQAASVSGMMPWGVWMHSVSTRLCSPRQGGTQAIQGLPTMHGRMRTGKRCWTLTSTVTTSARCAPSGVKRTRLMRLRLWRRPSRPKRMLLQRLASGSGAWLRGLKRTHTSTLVTSPSRCLRWMRWLSASMLHSMLRCPSHAKSRCWRERATREAGVWICTAHPRICVLCWTRSVRPAGMSAWLCPQTWKHSRLPWLCARMRWSWRACRMPQYKLRTLQCRGWRWQAKRPSMQWECRRHCCRMLSWRAQQNWSAASLQMRMQWLPRLQPPPSMRPSQPSIRTTGFQACLSHASTA